MIRIIILCALLMGCAEKLPEGVVLPKDGYLAVVPWGEGGGTDQVAKAVVDQLATRLDEKITIVYMPGEGGYTGTKWALDKGTHNRLPILTFGAIKSIESFCEKGLDYCLDDLSIYSVWQSAPAVVAVSTKTDIQNMGELQNELLFGDVSIATAGEFSAGDIGARALSKLLSANYESVRKTSGTEAARAVVRGEALAVVQLYSELRYFFADGTLRPLAMISDIPGIYDDLVIPPLSDTTDKDIPQLAVTFGFVTRKGKGKELLEGAWNLVNVMKESASHGTLPRVISGELARSQIKSEVEADKWIFK